MSQETECDNCGAVHDIAQLNLVKDAHERLTPGDIVPPGECPDCGALCYPVPEQTWRVYETVQYYYDYQATSEEEAIDEMVNDGSSGSKQQFMGVTDRYAEELTTDYKALAKAAPELLEACRMMLDKFEHDVEQNESGWDAIVQCRKAITKATG